MSFRNPNVWGPALWQYLHIWSLGYPKYPTDAAKDGARTFVDRVVRSLPCAGCRIHADEFVRKNPVRLGSTDDLVGWFIDFHNHANLNTGKPILTRAAAMDSIMADVGRVTQAKHVYEKSTLSDYLSFKHHSGVRNALLAVVCLVALVVALVVALFIVRRRGRCTM